MKELSPVGSVGKTKLGAITKNLQFRSHIFEVSTALKGV
jgi:hypothetical protein